MVFDFLKKERKKDRVLAGLEGVNSLSWSVSLCLTDSSFKDWKDTKDELSGLHLIPPSGLRIPGS